MLMLRFLSLLLLLLGCVIQPTLGSPTHTSGSTTHTSGSPEEVFSAWASTYHRNYTSEADRARRFAVFAVNLERMAQLQLLSPQALYAPDEHFDWTDQEKEGLTGLTKQRARDDQITFSDETVWKAEAAGDLDWVAKGAVTSPTSQGRCATCQDYSAAADIEGAWATSGHPLTKLSEQEMVDCGGGAGYGMDWVAGVAAGPHADPRGRGLATIEVAPDANHSDPNITGCRHVTNCTQVAQAKKIEGNSVHIDGVACFSHNESQILAGLQYGPISVSIAAGYFAGYKSGIINCSAHGIDHAVLLVGYGTDNSTEAQRKWGGDTKYWKLKNSWGPAFGEGGYFRFKFGNVCMRGACKAYIGKPPSP